MYFAQMQKSLKALISKNSGYFFPLTNHIVFYIYGYRYSMDWIRNAKIVLFYPKLFEDIKAMGSNKWSLACLLLVVVGFTILAFLV